MYQLERQPGNLSVVLLARHHRNGSCPDQGNARLTTLCPRSPLELRDPIDAVEAYCGLRDRAATHRPALVQGTQASAVADHQRALANQSSYVSVRRRRRDDALQP